MNHIYTVPHFICIGAMRSGSSWLHYNLKTHPQIYMPNIKEIHYFDKKKDGPYNAELLRKQINNVVKHHLHRRSIKFDELLWYLHYFICPRNDDWYIKNFSARSEKSVVGEVTPAYSVLDTSTIEEIGRKWPNLKIVLLIRNPIERAWSHVVKSLSRSSNTNIAEVDADKIRKRISDYNVLCRGDYTAIIDNWTSVYGRDRVYVGFYEQIAENPHGLMRDICEFLSVDYADKLFSNEHLVARVNNTSRYKSGIPSEFKRFLANHYYEVICEMNRRYGSYANNWEEHARELL